MNSIIRFAISHGVITRKDIAAHEKRILELFHKNYRVQAR